MYFTVDTKNTILISGLGPDEYFGQYKRFFGLNKTIHEK